MKRQTHINSADAFEKLKACVLIPCYNNPKTIKEVILESLDYCNVIVVIDDGSETNTKSEIESVNLNISLRNDKRLVVLSHTKNRGKGAALKTGFKWAVDNGFDYAVTLDADGQHFPSDLPLFAKTMTEHPNAIIIGSRSFSHMNMAKMSKFANRFSNFWFTLQTLHKLPDTQTGFRAYPLKHMPRFSLVTPRYEAELEMLVLISWKGTELIPINVNVNYFPKGERVSHFKPDVDFVRISILNTILCVCAFFFGYPQMIIRQIVKLSKSLLSMIVISLLLIAMFFYQSGLALFILFNRVTDKDKYEFHKFIQKVFRFFLKYMPNVDVSIRNIHTEIFEKPSVVICNHQSHLDLLCVLSLTPNLIVITKKWVWNNPLYALAIRFADYVPITNDINDNIERIRIMAEKGYSVLCFPEGTRSENCKLQRFHQGPFLLSKKLHLDIVPIYLSGTGKVLNKKARYLSKGEIIIDIGKRIEFSEEISQSTSLALAKGFRDMYDRYEEKKMHSNW